jgi:isopentenyl diphosphate isomerase/L-lactate dehydrogenase-like FMN-dependent dehydrogenase
MGEAGVALCLQIIQKELDITMALCGHTDIRQVDRSILLPPRSQMLAISAHHTRSTSLVETAG